MIRSRLKKARKIRGWSQRMLAEKSGIAQPLIAKYELGHQPSPRNLSRLSTALGVEMEYFYGPLQNSIFDDQEFDQLINMAKDLSLSNKIMLRTVLRQALYFQVSEENKQIGT
ncbi:MAG: helix-turn-helix transcriptional regulator [Daejeonella sp.]